MADITETAINEVSMTDQPKSPRKSSARPGVRDTVKAKLTEQRDALRGQVETKAREYAEQGKAKAVSVHTGITDGQWIEITDGLRGDEDVVVVGKRQLLDQSVVRTSPFQLPEATPAQQKLERRSAGGQPPAPLHPQPAVKP